jgi:hypothetical protein
MSVFIFIAVPILMAPAHWMWKRLPRSKMRRGSQSITFKQAINWLSHRILPCGKRFRRDMFRVECAGAITSLLF